MPVSIFVSWKQFTPFCFSLSKTKYDLYMVEKVTMTTAWLNSKFIEKNDILWVDNLKVIILSVIIRNFVLFCKPILVLNCHSLKHKPVISWNINHRYNFSLTSAIKQDIWYAFSKVSTLSIKI